MRRRSPFQLAVRRSLATSPAIVVAAACAVAGCAPRTRTFQPSMDPATLEDTAFLHYLATVPVVTVNEAARGLLLFANAGRDLRTFEERAGELARRGAFRSAWKLTPTDVLDKGTLAFALAALCDLPRSVNSSAAAVTGLGDRRAALQVCVYQGILVRGDSSNPVSGGEFLAALDAAERYSSSHPAAATESTR